MTHLLCVIAALLGRPECPAAGEAFHPDTLYTMARALTYTEEEAHEAVEIAQCESRLRADAVGDGGLAVGLFQIHPLWVQWAQEERGLTLDRADAGESLLLVLLIVREYNPPRRQARWSQWTCQPGWVPYAPPDS